MAMPQFTQEELNERWRKLQWKLPPEQRKWLPSEIEPRVEEYGELKTYKDPWYKGMLDTAKKAIGVLESKMPTVDWFNDLTKQYRDWQHSPELAKWNVAPQEAMDSLRGIKQFLENPETTPASFKAWGNWYTNLARWLPGNENLPPWGEQTEAEQIVTGLQAGVMIVGAAVAPAILMELADDIAVKFAHNRALKSAIFKAVAQSQKAQAARIGAGKELSEKVGGPFKPPGLGGYDSSRPGETWPQLKAREAAVLEQKPFDITFKQPGPPPQPLQTDVTLGVAKGNIPALLAKLRHPYANVYVMKSKPAYDEIFKGVKVYLRASVPQAHPTVINAASKELASQIIPIKEVGTTIQRATFNTNLSRVGDSIALVVQQLSDTGNYDLSVAGVAAPKVAKPKIEKPILDKAIERLEQISGEKVTPTMQPTGEKGKVSALKDPIKIGRRLEANPDDPILLSQQAEAIYYQHLDDPTKADFHSYVADDNLSAARKFWTERYGEYPEGMAAIKKAEAVKAQLKPTAEKPSVEVPATPVVEKKAVEIPTPSKYESPTDLFQNVKKGEKFEVKGIPYEVERTWVGDKGEQVVSLAPTTEAGRELHYTPETLFRTGVSMEPAEKAAIPTKKQFVAKQLKEYKKSAKEMGLPFDEKAQTKGIEGKWEEQYGGEVKFGSGPFITKEYIDKVLPKPHEFTINTEKAMYRHYAQSNEGVVYGKQIADKWQEGFKALPRKYADMKLLYKYREMPDKYGGELSAKARAVSEEAGKVFDQLHEAAKQHGVLKAFKENYFPHIYKDNPKDISKKMYPTGGRRMGTKFRFGKERKIANTDEAEELGLHPIYDIPTLTQVYTRSLWRTIANKNFIDTVRGMVDENGFPLILNPRVAPDNYEFIKEPAFKQYMYAGTKETKSVPWSKRKELGAEGRKIVQVTTKAGGSRNFSVPKSVAELEEMGIASDVKTATTLIPLEAKAHPAIAKIINNIASPYSSLPEWLNAIRIAQGIIKRLIMYNFLVHGVNIGSDLFDEMNFNIIKTVQALLGRIPSKVMDQLKYENNDELVLDMVQHGVASDAVWAASRELYERIKKLEKTDVAKPLRWLISLRDFNDKLLWGSIVLNSQKAVYTNYIYHEMQRNPDADVDAVKQRAARFTNNLLGTLPSVLFTKNEALFSNLLLFARNWTVSNLRLVTGAMGEYGTSTRIPHMLRHTGMTAEEANKAAPAYQKHLIKGLLALLFFATAINTAIKSAKKKKFSLWTPAEAEWGHWFDIDTQTRDARGRKKYIKLWTFRYIGDYVGWATEPAKTLRNKTEPLMRMGAEQLANKSLWQNRPITERDGTLKGLQDRLHYAARGVTPYGTWYGVTEPSDLWWEKYIMATGTWTRSGGSPEIYVNYQRLAGEDQDAFMKLLRDKKADFRRLKSKQEHKRKMSEEELTRAVEYAKKLYKFKKQLKKRWIDVDPKIDELFARGREREARKLMRDSGRYKTQKSIEDRIRILKGGVY